MKTTGVTLRELLQIPLLRSASVISGARGLERPVQFIDIMETPDLDGWVREGVLLMTTAYPIRHEPGRLSNMIVALSKGRAAGLAIKPAHFLQGIPEEAIRLSEECGLPLIELPPDIPYTEITQAVMEQVLDRQASMLRRSDEVYRKLTMMVLENIGIQAVNDHVSDLLKAPVAVIDNTGVTIVSSPAGWDYRQADHPLSWNINVDRRSVARLIVDKEKLDAMEEVGVEQARLVLALELMRNKIIEDTESRLRGNFIDELMTPPVPPRQEVEQRGRQLGMNPAQQWEIVVIEGQTAPEEEWMNHLLSIEADKYGVRPHVEFRSNRAILFLPTPPSEQEQVADGEEKEIPWDTIIAGWLNDRQGHLHGYRAGIGRPKWLWDIHHGYSEARSALTISRRLSGGGSLTAFKDVEIYHLLRGSVDERGFGELFDRKLGRLRQYDEEHHSDLLRTLFFYLDSRGSLMDTANHLFIHRNSVKYRLDRIRDITGIDLNDPHQQFIIHMCLIYYYLMEHPED
ncbi:PucR family transcriptional regulator [Paenibacillus wulumuqiensis]|uniref:PucR family transcriptional regulator n=1 Tax=Paenibacillus wulumuqiensis TaxID=1567107 RepID=UPI000619FD74|nr:PucR family transcriptional regulator ligand-binding domain-containing protein [Paenibacillus wulumuqiensis]